MVFHQISLDQTTLTQEVILMVIEVFGWSNLIQVDFQIRKNLDNIYMYREEYFGLCHISIGD